MVKTNVKLALPLLLTFNGGYVDAAGFLALHGLFAAHVTGNLVTLGAATVFGIRGVVAKLLAIPVFGVTVLLARLASRRMEARGSYPLPTLLTTVVALLATVSGLATAHGPYSNGDAWPTLMTGMILVTAMAVQNAAHRMYLAGVPPSTVVTGTTTQLMIAAADLLLAQPAEDTAGIHQSSRTMARAIGCFAIGAVAAAWLFSTVANWCFLAPPTIVLFARFAASDSRRS